MTSADSLRNVPQGAVQGEDTKVGKQALLRGISRWRGPLQGWWAAAEPLPLSPEVLAHSGDSRLLVAPSAGRRLEVREAVAHVGRQGLLRSSCWVGRASMATGHAGISVLPRQPMAVGVTGSLRHLRPRHSLDRLGFCPCSRSAGGGAAMQAICSGFSRKGGLGTVLWP